VSVDDAQQLLWFSFLKTKNADMERSETSEAKSFTATDVATENQLGARRVSQNRRNALALGRYGFRFSGV
jgi:hypothetical protein